MLHKLEMGGMGYVLRLQMGEFSLSEALGYVVRMVIFSLKLDRFTSKFPKFSPAARKNSTLLTCTWYRSPVGGGYVWMQRAVCCCAEHQLRPWIDA